MSTTADALRPSKAYPANCHCGKIAYTATLSPPLEAQEAIACNCSICARNGYVLAFTPGSSVEFQKGEGLAKKYAFGNRALGHYFCPDCGTSLFAKVEKEDSEMAGTWLLNLRAFKDIDVDKLKLKPYDGAALEPQYKI